MPATANKTAEAAFAKAAADLLGQGYNNFDLIKIMRIEANKVRDTRRAARTAKPAPKPATPAAPKAATPAK